MRSDFSLNTTHLHKRLKNKQTDSVDSDACRFFFKSMSTHLAKYSKVHTVLVSMIITRNGIKLIIKGATKTKIIN